MKASLRLLRNPHFWSILALFMLCTILYYPQLTPCGGRVDLNAWLGLERHALERFLFLLPITYAAFLFGFKAGTFVLVAALAVMLPRVFVSSFPRDALFETGLAAAFGALMNWWLESWRREIGRREQAFLKLEAARRELHSHVQVIRENERRLSALHSISTTVNQSLVLEEVLDVAADKIQEVMDIDVVLIFFLDEETGTLELRAHRGVSEAFAAGVTGLKVGEGFNGWVAQTGQPCFVEDVTQDPRLSREVVRQEGLKSSLIVPLKSKHKVVGTLGIATRTPRQFASGEQELLTLIGTELGVAAEKAFFLQELQRIGARYQEIFEKAHDAIWLQDLSGKIIAANQAASELTGYERKELIGREASLFFTPQGLRLARKVEQSLLANEEVQQPYEQRMVKKGGKEAVLMLTTSLLGDEKTPAFLHIARDITDERRLQENLRLYAHKISQAHEEERKRIARELHDDTIQTLVAISRRLDTFITRTLTPSQETFQPLEETQKEIDESLVRIRRFVQDLRPPTLEYLGLLPALRELATQVADQSGIQVNLEVEGTRRSFAPEEELIIYRIVQEALRNVWKHSNATSVGVHLNFGEQNTTIAISDNGRGFEVGGSLELLERGKLGLMGMEERAHLLGGHLEIISTPSQGTTVILSIPDKKDPGSLGAGGTDAV